MLCIAAPRCGRVVLGMLHESYVHSITILSAIPSAVLGALPASTLCKTDWNVTALIGMTSTVIYLALDRFTTKHRDEAQAAAAAERNAV